MRVGWIAGVLLAACSGVSNEEEPPPPPPATYEVHEWGFIGHHIDEGENAVRHVGATPGRFDPNALGFGHGGLHLRGGKPILYVHLGEGTDRTSFQARVTIPDGRFVEFLPAGTQTGNALTWQVEARRGSCSAVASYPGVGSPGCSRVPDGYCEAAELGMYETDDAACLQVDGQDWNHLFYRADASGALPMHFTNDAGLMMQANVALEGKMIRIWRNANRAETKVQIFDAPPPGQEMAVPDAQLGSADEGIAYVRQELTAHGMSAAESDAFMRAWETNLFGAREGAPAIEPLQNGRPPEGLQAATQAVAYFLPESAANRLLGLSFEPAPTSVKRAILVRVDLVSRAVGTIGIGNLGNHLGYGAPPRTRGSQIRTTLPEVDGALSPQVVRRIIRRYRSAVRGCYEDHEPMVEGAVDISFTVGGEGTVTQAAVAETSLDEAVGTCLVQRLRSWRFPTPETGTVEVRQRYLFEPPNEDP
ncbi:MAG: TonB family protein [Myxococcota bacterium]